MATKPYSNIIVIRKRSGVYHCDNITATRTLPGSIVTPEQNRENILSRLHSDDAVALIIENPEEGFDETVILDEGLEVRAIVDWGDNPVATIIVNHEGEEAYRDEFPLDELREDGVPYRSFLDELTDIINSADGGDYWFLSGITQAAEDGNDTVEDIYDVRRLLTKEGFPIEEIGCRYLVCAAFLFLHENDVVMVSSRHFNGEDVFIELKRLYSFRDPSVVRAAVDKALLDSDADVIEYPDGTWSFRLYLEGGHDKESFLKHLLSRVEELRALIERIEKNDDLRTSSSFDQMNEIRHLFIYEVLDNALKLDKLTI